MPTTPSESGVCIALSYTIVSATVALTIVYDNAANTPDSLGVIGVGTAGTKRSAASALAVGSSGI